MIPTKGHQTVKIALTAFFLMLLTQTTTANADTLYLNTPDPLTTTVNVVIGTSTATGTVQSLLVKTAISNFSGTDGDSEWYFMLLKGVSGQVETNCISDTYTANGTGMIVTNTGATATSSAQLFATFLNGTDCFLNNNDRVGVKIKRTTGQTVGLIGVSGTQNNGFFGVFTDDTAFTYLQTQPPQTQPQYEYINILTPTYGTTTTNTFTVSIQYQTPFTFDFRPTTTRTFVIKDAITLVEQYRYTVQVPANASENLTISKPVTLSNGSKIITAYYSTENGAIYSEVAESFFNVNVNTYLQNTGLTSPLDIATESQNDCNTFDIGCQFQKAILFLFQPSTNVLDKFSNTWRSIADKKPFGYVTVTIQSLNNLDDNSAHAFDVGTIPFQTAIFDPLRLALGSILWGIYAIYFYQRRLKHLDI